MEQYQVTSAGGTATFQATAQVAIAGGAGSSCPVAVMQSLQAAVQVSGTQVAQLSTQPQVLRIAQAGEQLMSGQQIMMQDFPQGQTIQIQGQPGQSIQQMQVIPITQLQQQFQGQSHQVIIQQPQGQILQTSDGQTLFYQPVMDGSANFVQASNGIIQIPAVSVATQSPQVVQTSTTATAGGGSLQTITLPSTVQQGNIVMMVPDSGGLPTMQKIPIPGAELVQEELLYVNAKQYHRILKRRQARARLEALGRIPKERRKYLHESRHQHAMNRIRSEGGRFHSRSDKDEICDKKLSTDSHANTDTVALSSNGLFDIGLETWNTYEPEEIVKVEVWDSTESPKKEKNEM